MERGCVGGSCASEAILVALSELSGVPRVRGYPVGSSG